MSCDSSAVTEGEIRAAEYLRKSTDHQKYSIENQAEAIRRYAATHGYKIVRTYTDEGKSGLTICRRPALMQLIEDVTSGTADFNAILVYDVSRWGRFQDADESAYHEFLCKRAGIKVAYCAEQFENDESPLSAIVKGVRRAMAGEYSRELSVKVFAGKSRLTRLGYRTGGAPGYGLRRLLVDQNGIPRVTLERGQWKSISTDRIILVPGPPKEVATVLWIFSAFVHQRMSEQEIARALNAKNRLNVKGAHWSRSGIKKLLVNEKYIGHNVWNRTSAKLQGRAIINNPETWVRAENAFQPIVPKPVFEAAQAIFRGRAEHLIGDCSLRSKIALAGSGAGRRPDGGGRGRRIRLHRIHISDERMLEKLRALLDKRGELTHAIIAEAAELPTRSTYITRFGSLRRAYELIGYNPDPYRHHSPRPHGLSDCEMLDIVHKLWRQHGYVSQSMFKNDRTLPSPYAYQQRFGGLRQAYVRIGYIRPMIGDLDLAPSEP